MFKHVQNLCLFLLILFFAGVSCTSDVDFNQINDLELTPIVESSLVFLDEPANQFLDNGVEIVVVRDSMDITFFRKQFINDYLVKADLIFETNNTINRGFQVQIDFLNEFNQREHVFTFQSSASISNTSLVESYTETFEDNSLAALKSTTKMVFTLTVLPGTPITENTIGTIQLKSKGVFFFNIDN